MVDRICECCRKPFTARQADVSRGWARFCSKSCKAIQQERSTGDYAAYQQRQTDRDHDYALADQGWDAHRDY